MNWDPQAGWRDRIVPGCDPDRLIRERFIDLTHALEVDAKGITLGTHRAQTFSVKRFPDYNAVVAASSGSGKSFLANELLTTNLSVGGRCWVIDVGRSYENLCEAPGGQFVALTRDAHLSVKPFGLIGSWEEEADVVCALVTAMAATTQPLLDIQSAGLKRVLKAAWEAMWRSSSRPFTGASENTTARRSRLPMCLIPFCCRNELCASGTAKYDRKTHRPMCASAAALTSLQGTTSSGFASWSVSRRSISALWASVGGGTALRFAISSQRASTKAN